MAGLLPITWSSGSGSEIMQRIAAPMIGGMISSTVLTLIVIPAIFRLVKGRGLSGDNGSASGRRPSSHSQGVSEGPVGQGSSSSSIGYPQGSDDRAEPNLSRFRHIALIGRQSSSVTKAFHGGQCR